MRAQGMDAPLTVIFGQDVGSHFIRVRKSQHSHAIYASLNQVVFRPNVNYIPGIVLFGVRWGDLRPISSAISSSLTVTRDFSGVNEDQPSSFFKP